MRGLPQKQNARRADKIRLCGHLGRYKKIVKKTYIILLKLETVVRGNSFTGKGKRVDALYQTSGIVKSLVFAEIKKPTTKLLTNDEYRPGCWAASKDLSGGIFQVHATVQAAEDEVSEHVVTSQDEEGCDIPSSEVFLFRPRAYLVIGSTKEFINENSGGKNRKKIRSFELFSVQYCHS